MQNIFKKLIYIVNKLNTHFYLIYKKLSCLLLSVFKLILSQYHFQTNLSELDKKKIVNILFKQIC